MTDAERIEKLEIEVAILHRRVTVLLELAHKDYAAAKDFLAIFNALARPEWEKTREQTRVPSPNAATATVTDLR